MPLIRTEARIPAPPARVFAVLTDFARYSAWNPLNLTMKGEARRGAHLVMDALNPLSGRAVRLTATITRLEPGRALEWTGGVPVVFRGRHFFELDEVSGGTHLVHGEEITGLLPVFVGARRLLDVFPPHYTRTNAALAAFIAAG